MTQPNTHQHSVLDDHRGDVGRRGVVHQRQLRPQADVAKWLLVPHLCVSQSVTIYGKKIGMQCDCGGAESVLVLAGTEILSSSGLKLRARTGTQSEHVLADSNQQ